MNYFKNCNDLNALKTEFRRLCLLLHPDHNNGNQKEFIAMYSEFKRLSNTLKFKTGFDKDKEFNADAFFDTVSKFDELTDININFVGSFIWLTDIVDGAMYRQKDAIKGISIDGYNAPRWARKKVSWYFSPQDYKQKYSKNKTIEQLKQTYQSKTFATRKSVLIN